MLEARFRPLEKWAAGKLQYKKAQFKMNYLQTLDLLEFELRKIQARDITVEAGFSGRDLRNDGWPRAGTRPSHPGVVLYCATPDGPLKFACGTYGRFEHNMHAIGLTLEALRAVDRYGATEAHEQYRGFAALPPAADAATAKSWTLDEAALWLAMRAASPKDYIVESAESYRAAYRRAAADLHPDAGGDEQGWWALQTVRELLDKHHGLSRAAGEAS